MSSWRDRLNAIDPEPAPAFHSHDKTDTSDKSPPFVSSVSFVMASQLPGETEAGEPAQLREWLDALSAIDRDRPAKGYQDDLWRHLHRDGSAFLDTWGETAAALGWSTLDLFGVHRAAPVANYSAMGLVPLLRGAVVVALTADEAVTRRGIGAALTFRRQPPHPEAVPVWELAR